MRYGLLGAAALIVALVVPASAGAQWSGSSGFTGAGSHGTVRVHRGFDRGHGEWRGDRDGDFRDEWRSDRDRDRRGRHDRGDVYFAYRDYQGDTLWRPESFNDWWHERPERSYPAWVARNAECERVWWSGGNWRC